MRAAIFIDGGYILQQQKMSKVTVDYERLSEYFLAPIRAHLPVDLMRCYFYYCAPWMSPEPTEEELRRMETHNKFVVEAENIDRWQVRLGKLEKRRDGTKEYYEQKRVDVLLSCDLVRHAAAGHIQHAILVAGDSDFIPAVTAAKEAGVTISVWCGPPNTIHKDLVTLADEVHRFDFNRMPKRAPQQVDNSKKIVDANKPVANKSDDAKDKDLKEAAPKGGETKASVNKALGAKPAESKGIEAGPVEPKATGSAPKRSQPQRRRRPRSS